MVSPLCAAAVSNKVHLTKLIVENGCDINRLSDARPLYIVATPLHYAILQGNSKMVKFLLDSGHDPNYPSNYHEYPLLEAIKHNCENISKLLIDCPRCDVDTGHCYYGGWDYPPLFQALFRYRRYSIAELLLDSKRCKLHFHGETYLSMLLRRAGDNSVLHLKICKLLLEAGADINPEYGPNTKPLTFLVNTNDRILNLTQSGPLIRLLILAGVKPTLTEAESLKPYMSSDSEQELVSWVKKRANNPCSLMEVCRYQLRQYFGTYPREALLQLPLPPIVLDYITFKDLRKFYGGSLI